MVLTAVGAFALAGCASIDYEPVVSPVTSTPSAPAQPPQRPTSTIDPAVYRNAPRAPLLSQLFACSPNNSNIGPISADRASLVYTPYIITAAGSLLRDPTEGACLSSGFGWRNRGEGGSNHTGIDLANPSGGFIFAAADGVVEYVGWDGGYGLVVQLDHGRGVHTLYGHLSDVNPALSEGSVVRAGAAIARMGMTGNATGVHLHYEVSINGLKVDPLNYGAPNVVQVTQSHDQPLDSTQAPQQAAAPAASEKPSAAPIETPDPGATAAPAAPPQPPASEPLRVTPGDDGWTPDKPN
ncbi:MAG: peptidoglycan DD-metalloendopeptidase family protein [Proteobacteria bacterium]|nr:peptidoglycan DD-metalloendopeptidase family protein [Pseudomonadota bacterium]